MLNLLMLMARGRGTFGLASSRGRARGSGYRGSSSSCGSVRGRGRGGARTGDSAAAPQQEDDRTQLAERFDRVVLNDEIDEKSGFSRVQEGPRREGNVSAHSGVSQPKLDGY
jgi:DNA polymerase epsilon subunit 1